MPDDFRVVDDSEGDEREAADKDSKPAKKRLLSGVEQLFARRISPLLVMHQRTNASRVVAFTISES